MAVALSKWERDYVAGHAALMEGSKFQLSALERSAVLNVAGRLSQGEIISYTKDSVLQRATDCYHVRCRELLALAKAVSIGTSAFETTSNTISLGESLGVSGVAGAMGAGGPAETSGMIYIVPFEIELSNGKWRQSQIRVQALWTDVLNDVQQKARQAIKLMFKDTTEPNFRLIL